MKVKTIYFYIIASRRTCLINSGSDDSVDESPVEVSFPVAMWDGKVCNVPGLYIHAKIHLQF